MTKDFTTNLLQILRNDGHTELPKSAATLLRSNKYKNKEIRRMKTKNRNKKYGYYVYMGIAENLKRIISPNVYKKRIIKLLVNIDGLPVFNHSGEQLWPILISVFDLEYESSPFMAATFCGKSKPNSVDEYLKDFITEIKELLRNGIDIEKDHFAVEIFGFVFDTPARSFLKCTKGHGGFYACERCEVKGVSIMNRMGHKKRIYANINSKLRTNRSFREQHQKEHHKDRSPLLDIPGFDPVRDFFLDSMHLLYIGIMKLLLEEWLSGRNRETKISASQREYLCKILDNLTIVPDDFQRKKFDLNDLSNWKATQYRFFLHYSSVVCLRKILKKDVYNHFMLFYVAVRILCSSELAITYIEYAKSLLRKFVYLFPSFYGQHSQNIVIHNLIHLADDVEYTNVELPAISAFMFENCLGCIKRIIRGNNKPLHQLIRRIAELHSCPIAKDLPKVNHPLNNCIRAKQDLIVQLYEGASHDSENNVKRINYRNVIIDISDANNTAQLNCGKILRITNISYTTHACGSVFLKGFVTSSLENLFQYPCNSKDIGIYKLGFESRKLKTFDINRIKCKCVILTIEGKKFAITMLHSP